MTAPSKMHLFGLAIACGVDPHDAARIADIAARTDSPGETVRRLIAIVLGPRRRRAKNPHGA